MLEELTQEQEALMGTVAEETIQAVLYRDPSAPDMQAVTCWLTHAYSLYGMAHPKRIEIVGSPYAAYEMETKLTGSSQRMMDSCGAGDAGWVARFDYFSRIGVLTDADEGHAAMLALRDFAREAYDTVLLDECAIVIARPRYSFDEQGNLHSATGPALEWQDGHREYAWHGVWVDERVVVDPRSYTREEYVAITDTEQRRALGESAGWGHIVALLGATELDSWTDSGTGLSYTLLSAESGEKWLRKQSPALQDGSHPDYVEPVHEDLRTAQAARKWQATDWAPDECERDPILTYGIET